MGNTYTDNQQKIYDEIISTRGEVRKFSALLEAEFQRVHANIGTLQNDVACVENEVLGVKGDVQSFKIRFEEFVDDLEKKNNITHAQGQIVILNQEIEKQFGLYEKVRKNLLGILQSVDTGLVSKQAITNATEELMLGTPRYWLTPSLIALAAWISNNRPLAEKALNEGMTRHQLKTILIFTLISNRLKRGDASFMWLSKYFENQNPLEMPQETLILVNAYTDGVFGPDSQGECMVQISNWLKYLSKQPKKVKELEERWMAKISVMPISEDNEIPYQYLLQYSPDFTTLMDLLHKAKRNESFLHYLERIINAEKIKKDYITELDDILFKLVQEYDADEFELRKKHKLCELILKYDGDKELAQQDFDANVITMFKDKVTFFDILVNAVTVEGASPPLRKLAILLMKEWIVNAHQDFVAQYRSIYPESITLKINDWQSITKDGSEIEELTSSYKNYLREIFEKALAKLHPSYWAIAITVGFFFWLISSGGSQGVLVCFGISAIALGINIWKTIQDRNALRTKYEKDCDDADSLIQALCAEFVDWQKAYKTADEYAEKVSDYIEKYSSDDFSENSAAKKILMFDMEEV